jgi:hypothetical protein
MKVLEGAWDCKQCGTKNRARHDDCTNCGDPKEGNEVYYLPDDAEEIVDPGPDPGPDWECGDCNASNDHENEVCRVCGELKSGNDIVNAVRTYVDGVDAEGRTLSHSSAIAADEVDTVLEAGDNLRELEDTPVSERELTLAKADLSRQAPGPAFGEYPGYPGAGDSSTEPSPGGWPSLGDRREDGIEDYSPASVRSAILTKLQHLPWRPIIWVAAALVALALLIGGIRLVYVNFFAASPVTLVVQDLDWERAVEVEEYRTLQYEDWDVPSDGRVIRQSREIRTYRREFDHYETRYRTVSERVRTGSHTERYACGSTTRDMGNGRYQSETTYCNRTVDDYSYRTRQEPYQEAVYRDVPVYDTRYTYVVDRWVTDHMVRAPTAADGPDVPPYWPIPDPRGPKQRVGDERQEEYEVIVVDEKGRVYDRDIGRDTWYRLEKGERMPAMQTRSGRITEITYPTS